MTDSCNTANLRSIKGMTVLYAEDELFNQHVMASYLNDVNVAFKMVNNGEELYNLYKKEHENFDVIISDIHMPIMMGPEAIKKIRKYE